MSVEDSVTETTETVNLEVVSQKRPEDSVKETTEKGSLEVVSQKRQYV